MGGLFGGSAKSNAAGGQKYTQLALQSSAYGLPVPIVYGTARLAPDLIDYQNFQQHTVNSGSAAGGKGGAGGGGGKGAGTTTTSYTVDWLGLISEGPINGFGFMWKSQTRTDPTTDNLARENGSVGQAPWAYWQDTYPANGIGYSGFAYVGAANYNLGNSAQLPNFNFEVIGFMAGSAQGDYGNNQYITFPDADPALIVPDLLTNAQYGAGFPSGRVAELANNSEAHTVPASGPYTVTVTESAGFAWNLDVVKADGTLFTCVAGSPATGQYSQAGGTYTFAAADAGASVTVNYVSAGALSDYQTWCRASGLWLSMALTSQTDAASILTDIGTATHADPVWSAGYLRMVPRGTVTIGGFGAVWNPPAAPVVAVTDDDLMPNSNPIGTSASSGNSDPVILTRKRKSDQINDVKFECLDRANQYAATVVEVTDQALIDKYGRRTSAGKSLHMLCDVDAANRSAALQMQDQYILNKYSFQLDMRFCFLDPGDLITLTTKIGALVLNALWVRITEVQENSDGTLSFVAEEYPAGTGAPPELVLNTGTGYAADFNADPGNVISPVFFEPPDALAGALEVWVALAGQSSVWGGCDVWVSRTGTTYEKVGTVVAPSRMGILSATLPSGSAIDQTNTLSVDLTVSKGALASGTVAEATALDTLCYVDGEYLAYETATLTSANKYDLTYLVRGAEDSTIGSHAAGSAFVRLDGAPFRLGFAASDIGQTIQVKFRSFNIYGAGLQDLAAVPAYSYTAAGTALGSPLPDVTGLTSTFVDGFTTLQWNAVSDFRAVDYEIRRGTSWATGQVLGRTPTAKWVADADGTYWVAAHSNPTMGLDVYSGAAVDLAIAGAVLVRNVVASWDEAATGFTGTVSGGAAIANGGLTLGGAGNLLASPNLLAEPDLLYLGGVATDGYYEIPAGHQVDIGRVAACALKVNVSAEAVNIRDNLLTVPDLLSMANMLSTADPSQASVTVEIALATTPGSFGPWAPFVPGQYNARQFALRLHLQSFNDQVTPVVTGFSFTVDVPDRVDAGTEVAVAAGGLAVTYSSPFNNVPNVQVTILDAQAGDTLVLTGRSASGFTMQITNGGSGVARTVNWIAQGY